MSYTRRGILILIPVLLCLAGSGCDGSSSESPPPNAPPPYVGRWISDLTTSQLGRIIHTWEFTSEGTYSVSLDFVDAKIPDQKDRGEYVDVAGTLHLTGSRRTYRMTYALETGTLVLVEPNGDTYRLKQRGR